jgi:hypothetical protein
VTCTGNANAGVQADGSFCLNDTGNSGKTAGSTDPAQNSTGNTVDETKVPALTAGKAYSVSESSSDPSGFQFESLTCSADSTSGSSVSPTSSTSNRTATITLKPAGVVTCVYQNEALGSITIIKHTSPRGINQQFSYAGTGTGVSSTFALNDDSSNDAACTLSTGSPAAGPHCNTITFSNLVPNTYTVNETLPAGWTLGSGDLTCNSTDGSQDTTTLTKVNISLHAGESITCTYVNHQPVGAIVITKESSKAAATPLAGATFEVCSNNGPYDPTTNPCNRVGNYPTGQTSVTTGSNGTACVDGLPWNGSGTTYYVHETAPPSGYALPSPTFQSKLVNADASCPSTGTPATVTFFDTPLTDLTVHVASEAAGGTKSAIFCQDSSSNPIGNSPQPTGAMQGVTSTYADPVTLNADPTHGAALKPGTYTCTIVIDP